MNYFSVGWFNQVVSNVGVRLAPKGHDMNLKDHEMINGRGEAGARQWT